MNYAFYDTGRNSTDNTFNHILQLPTVFIEAKLNKLEHTGIHCHFPPHAIPPHGAILATRVTQTMPSSSSAQDMLPIDVDAHEIG
jgi:hypothetical protein